MTGLRDLLKKKEQISNDAQQQTTRPAQLDVPEFRIIRTTTESEEVIEPPSFPDDEPSADTKTKEQKKDNRRTLGFRRFSHAAQTKDTTPSRPSLESQESSKGNALPIRPKNERRLSERLHLGGRSRSRSNDASSSHLPENLPAAPDFVAVPTISVDGADDEEAKAEQARKEAQWEKRATILASGNKLLEEEQKRQQQEAQAQQRPTNRDRSPSISDKHGDENIQEAIRLHEAGDLEASTQMFGRLADPKGANNALSQVLYGLALRHGWGITPEPEKAIHYLSLAASNSAAVEQAALASGMTKGGAAKGELVLAIFELANCFRHGWGVKKDPHAARQYYETAANLGDTDAMDEAAWCYTEGFGGAKDKVSRIGLCHTCHPPRAPLVCSARHDGFFSPASKASAAVAEARQDQHLSRSAQEVRPPSYIGTLGSLPNLTKHYQSALQAKAPLTISLTVQSCPISPPRRTKGLQIRRKLMVRTFLVSTTATPSRRRFVYCAMTSFERVCPSGDLYRAVALQTAPALAGLRSARAALCMASLRDARNPPSTQQDRRRRSSRQSVTAVTAAVC